MQSSVAKNVIWRPQPKQTLFLSRAEYEALYGGAAGGGKSDALLAEALRQADRSCYRGLILRKTFPDMTELIDRSQEIYGPSHPRARYNDNKHVWTFPSGAKIYFGSMQHTKDRTKYQGKRYDFIGFDELTHFTYDEYSYLFSRNRPNGPGMRTYIRATANPGGVGHGWVKNRFITVAPPRTTVRATVKVRMPDGSIEKFVRTRIFIPATVFDNPKLLDNDPTYIAKLAMMPEDERNALLYGDWNSFAGQVFWEWKNDPEHYDDQLWTHVIKPFPIPAHWPIIRGFDFGYAKPFSVGWFAIDEKGCMYHFAEYYGCNGTPNVGVKLNPAQIAQEIKRIEHEHPLMKGRSITGVADPSIWDESRGTSIADMMAADGVYFGKGDNTRLAGKMQVHYRLAFDDGGRPMLYVFDTCKHFIRTIPTLVYDATKAEEVNTDQEDHIYDMLRYVAMIHKIKARAHVEPPMIQYDPLDLYKDKQQDDKYAFFRI